MSDFAASTPLAYMGLTPPAERLVWPNAVDTGLRPCLVLAVGRCHLCAAIAQVTEV